MKKTKLVTTVLLVLALLFSLFSFAAADVETGTITVTNPIAGQKYNVYRIFDLESYNKTSKAYSYTLNQAWNDFARQNTIDTKFITLEDNGQKVYVKWIEGADVNAFAKLAIEWAKAHTNDVKIKDAVIAESTDPIVFENLPLGYYLIDSSVGALCALTTNDPNATVNEKNELTTVLKLVKENSTNDYVPENTAKLGDTVSFKSEITVGEGVENLVLHDEMSSYLSLKTDSIKVYINQETVDAKYYTVDAEWVGEDKAFHSAQLDDCTFNISFTNAFVSTLSKGTVIRVEYDAVLEWCEKEWKTFENETWVGFGDGLTSTHSKTKTNTYSFDLLKTDDKGVVIQTAKFCLYDAQQGGNVIPLVALGEDSDTGVYRYRVATAKDAVEGNGAPIKAGYAYVYGLDKQMYYLEETEQPVGYNKLTERVKVDLTNGDIKADTSGDFYAEETGSVLGSLVEDAGGLRVINKSGTVLPGTGGVGTTAFYILGGVLAAAAGVLLITGKRMRRESK